jgi:Tfp pilus assembly protein PilN
MIRVNLIGATKRKTQAGGAKKREVRLPTNLLPIVWVAIVVTAVAAGSMWYSGLATEVATLDTQIASAVAQREQLRNVINENLVYENRLGMLQERLSTIAGLQRDQVSPVLVMDILGRATDSVDYIWLNSFSQNNTQVSVTGNGSSQIAVADFITSLENTGYFGEITLGSLAEAGNGLVTFDLSFQFVPPRVPAPPDGGDDDGETGEDDTESAGESAE